MREKGTHSLNKFKEKLTAVNWLELEGFHYPNQSYQTFHSKFTQIIYIWIFAQYNNKLLLLYNTSFPIKQIKQKHHLAHKPWLSKGILKSIKRKNKLYKQYLCNPTPEIESYYKRYKNKLNHSLRIAKSSYYVRKLENIKSDMKSTWKFLTRLLTKKDQNLDYRHHLELVTTQKFQTRLKLLLDFAIIFLVSVQLLPRK